MYGLLPNLMHRPCFFIIYVFLRCPAISCRKHRQYHDGFPLTGSKTIPSCMSGRLLYHPHMTPPRCTSTRWRRRPRPCVGRVSSGSFGRPWTRTRARRGSKPRSRRLGKRRWRSVVWEYSSVEWSWVGFEVQSRFYMNEVWTSPWC